MKEILIHFSEEFIEIFLLIYFATFIVALFKNKLSTTKIKQLIEKKNKWIGYFIATMIGLFTPFCLCSSIPIFIGLIAAKISIGFSLSFLISSPLLSEVAVVLLPTIKPNGWEILAFYMLSGLTISIVAGYLSDKLHLDKEIIFEIPEQKIASHKPQNLDKNYLNLIKDAHNFSIQTIKSILPYIIIALIIEAVIQHTPIHDFIISYMNGNNWLEVPIVTLIGAIFNAHHASLIPLVKSLLEQNVAIGTAMAFLMSTTVIAIPELIMLKKIFSTKLLFMFIGYLLISFMFTGYLLNFIQ